MSPSVESGPRYHIDLDWYNSSNRSFATLAESRLCSDCRDKKTKKKKDKSDGALLAALKDCCAKKPDFITPHLPVLETVFRLFLANGNEPMTVTEMGQELRQLRLESFAPGPDVLRRVLSNEGFYGLHAVAELTPDQPAPEPEKEQ
jgi:hypothetical protein